MIAKEVVEKALAAFMANTYWKGVFDRAPDGAKRYIKFAFAKSEFPNDITPEDIEREKYDIESNLTPEDWDYLVEHFAKDNLQQKNALIKLRRAYFRGEVKKPEGDNYVEGAPIPPKKKEGTVDAAKAPTDSANNGTDEHANHGKDGLVHVGDEAGLATEAEVISQDVKDKNFGMANDSADGQGDGGAANGGDNANGGTGGDGADKDIEQAEVEAAIYEFIGKPKVDENGEPIRDENGEVQWDGGNPYWRDLYLPAPMGAQERMAITFYFSENYQKPDFPLLRYRAHRKGVEDSLTFEDLEYLIANEDNEDAKKHYQDLYAKLTEKEGDGGAEGDGNADGGDGNDGNGATAGDSAIEGDGNGDGNSDDGNGDNGNADDGEEVEAEDITKEQVEEGRGDEPELPLDEEGNEMKNIAESTDDDGDGETSAEELGFTMSEEEKKAHEEAQAALESSLQSDNGGGDGDDGNANAEGDNNGEGDNANGDDGNKGDGDKNATGDTLGQMLLF